MDLLTSKGHRESARPGAPLAAILALAALSVACSGGSVKGAPPQGPAGIPVRVETAQLIAVKDTTEYVAALKSRDTAVIMPQVEGQITGIFVHSGSRVAAGTPLMQIDPAKQQAALKTQEDTLAAKQAEVKWDEQEFERNSGLYDAKVISKQALDQSRTALDQARAQLQALQAQVRQESVQLHYYRVTAPSAGIVGDIPVRVGDRVTTSTPLTTVDKPGSLEAYVYVPIERSSQLKLNLPVQIVDQSGNVIAESRLNFVSPQVDATTQTVLAKAPIANNNDKLRNAQFIHARIVWGTQQRTVVPALAVSRLGGQYFAFVAEQQDGKTVAHQKPLQVGDMAGNNYVVLEGIKPGDKIIVSGTQFLVDGAPVIIPQG
ncbi:MAG: efflux RND transporter periplasmic adaptor subunit [Acidobacteriia bacterium]|jgi:RND family efflux transporter MFP subunit|nr:efflux RND transporter periplasmic adaptor subunit [Terriglobia bacterium]